MIDDHGVFRESCLELTSSTHSTIDNSEKLVCRARMSAIRQWREVLNNAADVDYVSNLLPNRDQSQFRPNDGAGEGPHQMGASRLGWFSLEFLIFLPC